MSVFGVISHFPALGLNTERYFDLNGENYSFSKEYHRPFLSFYTYNWIMWLSWIGSQPIHPKQASSPISSREVYHYQICDIYQPRN